MTNLEPARYVTRGDVLHNRSRARSSLLRSLTLSWTLRKGRSVSIRSLSRGRVIPRIHLWGKELEPRRSSTLASTEGQNKRWQGSETESAFVAPDLRGMRRERGA